MKNNIHPFLFNWYLSAPWILNPLLLLISIISLVLVVDNIIVKFTTNYFPNLSWQYELTTIIVTIIITTPLLTFFISLVKHLHKTYDELSLSNEKLDKKNETTNSFLLKLSHELRTPLNAILGYCQILQLSDKHLMDKAQKDSINEINNAGIHLRSLVNDILDFSKIETENFSLNYEKISSQTIISESIAMVQNLAEEKQIGLHLNAIEDHIIYVDRLRTRQVLINVLNNAIKYNKPIGKVFISCVQHHNFARFEIIDTGIGINPEAKKDLFKPFKRLGAEKLHIEGIGIGLSLSKRIVDDMNGKIHCKSIETKGTTFYVDLPLYSE